MDGLNSAIYHRQLSIYTGAVFGVMIDHGLLYRQTSDVPLFSRELSPMKHLSVVIVLAATGLSGCSGISGLSTSSILGGSGTPPPAAAPAAASTGDPTSRAFQVGTVSARAVKCGYNFDPVKLKTSFLAAEVGQGASSEDVPRIEKIYDVAFSGVTKAVAADPRYCTEQRTKEIKTELTRHLAGDFTPAPPKKLAQEDGGLFSGFGDSSSKSDGVKMTLPTDNR